MNQQDIVVVDYAPEYAREIVTMWRNTFEKALGVVDPHPFEAQLQAFEEKIVRENHVVLVLEETTSAVIGFMASTPEMISHLYVDVNHQKRGIGSALMNLAKLNSNGRLRLFTFDVNKNAQRFYKRHGFKIIGRGFEKEWQLDDIEYEWSASDAAT